MPDTSAFDRALALFAEGKFAESESAARAAMLVSLERQPKDIAGAIQALDLAGWSALMQVHYDDALKHFRQEASLTSKYLNPGEWALVHYNLAQVLALLGQYTEILEILPHVVQVFQELSGPHHSLTLSARSDLAVILGKEGKHTEAEAEHRAIWQTRQGIQGAEHPETLASRNNRAVELSYLGRHAEAEAEHRAVLAIRERDLEPDHPDTLSSRNNIALALMAQEKVGPAATEFRTLLAIRLRVQGARHPETSLTGCDRSLM